MGYALHPPWFEASPIFIHYLSIFQVMRYEKQVKIQRKHAKDILYQDRNIYFASGGVSFIIWSCKS